MEIKTFTGSAKSISNQIRSYFTSYFIHQDRIQEVEDRWIKKFSNLPIDKQLTIIGKINHKYQSDPDCYLCRLLYKYCEQRRKYIYKETPYITDKIDYYMIGKYKLTYDFLNTGKYILENTAMVYFLESTNVGDKLNWERMYDRTFQDKESAKIARIELQKITNDKYIRVSHD